MHILLIRHGQSTNNVVEAALGDCPEFYQRRVVDPPLSPLGQSQAGALACHLGAQLHATAAQGRIRIVCSSMARALQTTAPLSEALGVTPLVRPDVVERCAFFSVDPTGTQLAQPGPTAADVLQRFPKFDASLLSASAQSTLETAAEARERAARVAAELLATAQQQGAEAPELLVLVAHADFIGMLVRALLLSPASPPAEGAYWDLNNTATVHITVQASGKVRLLHWNRSDHLNEALRTAPRGKDGKGPSWRWQRHGYRPSCLSQRPWAAALRALGMNAGAAPTPAR